MLLQPTYTRPVDPERLAEVPGLPHLGATPHPPSSLSLVTEPKSPALRLRAMLGAVLPEVVAVVRMAAAPPSGSTTTHLFFSR